jgi:hypothetical protein
MTCWTPVQSATPLTLALLPQFRSSHPRPVRWMAPRTQIRRVIEQSITENEIEVTIDTSEMGSEAATNVQEMMLKLATEVLSDRLIPALFGDRPDEPGAASAAEGGVASNLVEVESGLGDGGDATFSLELEHNAVVDRAVNPNGPLQILIPDPEALKGCFRELRLADGFFSEMRVTAQTAGVSFEKDGIELVKLEFEYEEVDEANPDRPTIKRGPQSRDNTVLRSESDLAHWRFDTARAADGTHKRQYRYRFEVHYRDGAPRKSEWRTSQARQLVITPGAMGALRVELALTAPAAVVRSARVELRHQTGSGQVYEAQRTLTPGGDRPVWLQYTGEVKEAEDDLEPPAYSYRVTYDLGPSTLVTPWTEGRTELLEIPTPFSRTHRFTLRPQGSFEGVASVVGDLIYEDTEHAYTVRHAFAFSGPADAEEVDIPVLDGGPETIRWTARIVGEDGNARDLEGGPVGPGSVWIGGETEHLKVEVRPDLIDFVNDIQLAVVTLSYDSGNGLERKVFTFSKESQEPQTWRAPKADGAAAGYDVDVRYVGYDRARSVRVTMPQITDELLLLDPPPANATPTPAPDPATPSPTEN